MLYGILLPVFCLEQSFQSEVFSAYCRMTLLKLTGGPVLSMGKSRTAILNLAVLAVLALFAFRSHAQAALLMEEPYGFFGLVNPTGHNAIYFERICAETPVKLRRCQPGEMGAVIARYQGIDGYDWVAIPLVPYLYSVENPSDVPARVTAKSSHRLRNRYREAHLLSLGDRSCPRAALTHGGWTQLLGVSYERRIYAFRFRDHRAAGRRVHCADERRPESFALSSALQQLRGFCAGHSQYLLSRHLPAQHLSRRGMTTPKQIA